MKVSKKPKLKVIFFVDTEADFYYRIPSPQFSRLDVLKWKLNRARGRWYRYPFPSRNGFMNILEACKRHGQKATFCIVGHLYLKSCRGFPHFHEQKPQDAWYTKVIGKDWYFWYTGGDYRSHPGLYLGDVIRKEKKNRLFDFGLHAFSHEALTLESEKSIHSFVRAGVAAAKQCGVKITSFACPFEMTEDAQDPEKVARVLARNKISTLFQSHLRHAGISPGDSLKKRYALQKPVTKGNVKRIYLSEYVEGTSSRKHLKKIMGEILAHRQKDAVYCLGTHDFTHKNTKNLDILFTFLKEEGFS